MTKRAASKWLILACGACTLLLSSASHSEWPIAPEVARLYTIIENGDFETGEELPAWWRRHPGKPQNRNRHARDTLTARNGNAAALIEWHDPIAGANKAPMQWSHYGLPVEAGIELLFTGYVKREGAGPARIGINAYDRNKDYLGFVGLEGPEEAEDWTYLRGAMRLPPTASSMGFILYSREGGRTWYDDVALLGVPEMRAVRGTPRVDGVLDEPCWSEDRAITTFVHHEGTGLAKLPVRSWVAYDDQALYIALRCPFPPGSELKPGATHRDGDTWLDESVEILLDPSRSLANYYRFSINNAGVLCDAHGEDISWNSSAQTRTSAQCDAWFAEIAIPYTDLALDLSVSDRWGINLARNDRVTGETVIWSLGGLRNAARFGGLNLSPNLSPILLPALLEKTNELTVARDALARTLKASALDHESAPEAHRLLGEATAQLTTAARVASGAKALAGATAGEMHSWVEQISTLLSEARVAALAARFEPAQPQNSHFKLVVAGSMQKVRRTGPVLDGILTNRVQMEAARDETESFQLVVIPAGEALTSVIVDAPPLEGAQGMLPLEWNRVDYVETGEPKHYKPEYVGWWPDVLMPPGPFGVKQGERQPLWFKVSVPPDAAPGVYTGQVVVTIGDKEDRQRRSVPVELRVRSFTLPRPGSLPAAFGLYAHALSNWYHGKTPYRDVMTPEVYARWCEFMGQYRLTPKNIANEYHRRVGEGDAKRLDLGLLNTTLTANAEKCYPPDSFCVYRLPCPRDVQNGTTTTDPAIWVRALTERAAEYKRVGLPSRAYVYGIDEPSPSGYPFIQKVYGMVKEAVPDFPIMQTVNHTPPKELAGLVDIWCPLSSKVQDDFYRERKEAGDTVWSYVCCSPKPPYANFFVDQPAIDHRMVFWQTRQAGATGLLYWCVCWWGGLPGPPSGEPHFPEVPIQLKDLSFTYTGLGVNGDGILIWPGPDMMPYPSLRLEVVRDGIEDYEYLTLLQRCVDRAQSLPANQRPESDMMREAKALCSVPDTVSRTFTDFTKEAGVLLARRRAVGDMIERLVEILGGQPPLEQTRDEGNATR